MLNVAHLHSDSSNISCRSHDLTYEDTAVAQGQQIILHQALAVSSGLYRKWNTFQHMKKL